MGAPAGITKGPVVEASSSDQQLIQKADSNSVQAAQLWFALIQSSAKS